MSNTTQEAVIYCRVSTEEQAVKGLSLDDQARKCKRKAEELGYLIPECNVFEDRGKTATNMNRRGLENALIRCGEKQVKAFIVLDTDRLARNECDHFAIKGILEKHKIKSISVNQPNLNETVEGKLMDTIVSGINAYQSRHTGRKVSGVMQLKVERGEWINVAPNGYLNTDVGTKEKPIKTITVNEKFAPLVVEAFELCATGNYNCKDLNNILYEKGLRNRRNKKVPKSSFIDMLHNPFYYGMMRYKGGLYKGNYKPLISKALFDTCQEVLAVQNNHANRERKHSKRFFLRGFLRCGVCGYKTVTAEYHKNRGGLSYYHCSGTKKKHIQELT